MNRLCGALENLWYNFYNTCFRNVDMSVRYTIGTILIVLSIITFIFSTKGKSKSELINNWFLFWISMILLIIGVLYMSIWKKIIAKMVLLW